MTSFAYDWRASTRACASLKLTTRLRHVQSGVGWIPWELMEDVTVAGIEYFACVKKL